MIGGGADLRDGCSGVVALPARLEPWQAELCERPDLVRAWLDEHGSPVNLLNPSPMERNAGELRDAAARFGLDLGIYFARKANKALGLVAEARRLGLGVDLAGERELEQVLDLGIGGEALVMTAAVKPEGLLRLCVDSQTTVVVDNADELRRLERVAAGRPVPIALRLAPDLGPGRTPTRFGLTAEEALALADGLAAGLRVDGVHFHLDGYAAADRVTALAQAVRLTDALAARGHRLRFVDIGGGIPMRYLDSQAAWEGFWAADEPLTFEGHELRRSAVYPAYQDPIRGDWLASVLAASTPKGRAAGALSRRGLQLRCEPGRALLDGCGLTVARVAHRKRRADGTWLIALEMNRTQCRSAADDFLVDPLLLRPELPDEPTGPIEGHLVGAYCIERELLTWRRLRFPRGVAVGDIVVFPNTAGYLMHILESSSHQIPLARNLLVRDDGTATLDPIDAG